MEKSFFKSIEFKIALMLSVIAIVGFLVYLCYVLFFFPAYMSYVSVCKPDGAQILADNNMVTAGAVVYNVSSGNVSVEINPDYADRQTILHEECHMNQIRENRLYSCSYPLAFWAQEVECYIREYF